MQQYWVEGLYRGKKGKAKGGKASPLNIEPFAKSFWANSPEEALRMASEELAGVQWVEGPRVNTISEEQRMRAMGAPELPGLGPTRKKATTRSKQSKRRK